MKESLILSQWYEKGWIWIEKDELLLTLNALSKEGITMVYIQSTATGFFVRKMY